MASISPTEQLSPENETLERRNLKSILKKLSAGSRTGSSETSATSTPDREAATAELRKLMRAPTIEGYAARHSKLSKSVTFNKYTLQSPPSEQIPVNYPIGSHLSDTQEQASLPPPNKLSFRPLGSGGILQMVSRPREEEYLGELVSGIKEIVKGRLVSFLYLFLFFLYIYFICMQLRTLRKLYYRIKNLLYIYIYRVLFESSKESILEVKAKVDVK